MANPRLGGKLLSFAFIGFCFCVGIGIGVVIRYGRSQATNTPDVPSNTAPEPYYLPDSNSLPYIKEPTYTDSITIQAVGDIIPGKNFPEQRLPSDRTNHFQNQ